MLTQLQWGSWGQYECLFGRGCRGHSGRSHSRGVLGRKGPRVLQAPRTWYGHRGCLRQEAHVWEESRHASFMPCVQAVWARPCEQLD